MATIVVITSQSDLERFTARFSTAHKERKQELRLYNGDTLIIRGAFAEVVSKAYGGFLKYNSDATKGVIGQVASYALIFAGPFGWIAAGVAQVGSFLSMEQGESIVRAMPAGNEVFLLGCLGFKCVKSEVGEFQLQLLGLKSGDWR